MAQEAPPWIHIELVPVWVHIKNLRHFVREFAVGMAVLPETADQVAMATSELLENATKYASTRFVLYDLRLTGSTVEVSVKNQATAAQRAELLSCIEDVSEGDALDAYVRCLERQGTEGSSRSGLARIRYEAGAELAVTVEGDVVSMVARIPL